MQDWDSDRLRKELETIKDERDLYRDRVVFLEGLWRKTEAAALAYYEAFSLYIESTSPVSPPRLVDPEERRPLNIVQDGVGEDRRLQGHRLPFGDGEVSEVPGECSGL